MCVCLFIYLISFTAGPEAVQVILQLVPCDLATGHFLQGPMRRGATV